MWHIYKIVKQNENQNENIWYFELWVAFLKCQMYIYIYIYIKTLPLKTKSIHKWWLAKWLGVWLYLFKSAWARLISGISISYLQIPLCKLIHSTYCSQEVMVYGKNNKSKPLTVADF